MPADAEIVLEGYLDERGWVESEGPYGEYVGYYGVVKRNPVFHVTAITRRKDAVLTSIISQVTPSESSVVKKLAYEPLYLAHLRDHPQPTLTDLPVRVPIRFWEWYWVHDVPERLGVRTPAAPEAHRPAGTLQPEECREAQWPLGIVQAGARICLPVRSRVACLDEPRRAVLDAIASAADGAPEGAADHVPVA